jgi:hypothetical protein
VRSLIIFAPGGNWICPINSKFCVPSEFKDELESELRILVDEQPINSDIVAIEIEAIDK